MAEQFAEADPFEFLDTYDVLTKLPTNFYSEEGGVTSKKWQERKEALEALLKQINDNPKLNPKANYNELIGTLNKLLAKDANINVAALAAKCLGALAYGLRKKFGPHVSAVLPSILDKFKDKKPLLREPLIECIDRVGATVDFDVMEEALMQGLENKNPQIKAQTDLFIERYLRKLTPQTMPKKMKALSAHFVKHTFDPDVEVREVAYTTLGAIQRVVGEKVITNWCNEIAEDKMKMTKINEASQKLLNEIGPCGAVTKASASTGPIAKKAEEAAEVPSISSAVAPVVEADPFDFLDPYDVLSKLPPSFYAEEGGVMSKKWQERKEALEALLKQMVDNPKLEPKANYGELIGTLNKLLAKDANINVAALAAKCLGAVAYGLRKKFGPHASAVLPSILDKFKEKKPLLREPLIECIDRVGATVDFDVIEEGLIQGLENKNPQIKAQTDLFIERYLRKLTPQTISKKMKALSAHFVKHTSDPDVEVREAAYSTLGAIQRIVGEKVLMNWCTEIADDKMKMTKISEAAQKILNEIGPCVTAVAAAPPPKKTEEKKVAGPPKPGTPAGRGTQRASSRPSSRAASPTTETDDQESRPTTSRKPVPGKAVDSPKDKKDSTSTDMLKSNGDKPQRLKDEAALRMLKWNFNTPTDEHIEQLSSLIGQYALSALQGMLFSKDFKMHIKACEEILKVAETNPEAMVNNSDLLLKWCTLRFFETNPSALIKVLELALRVLRECEAAEEPFSNTEVAAFLPYLLTKLGDPKDHIRGVIKEIIDSMTSMCGPGKLTQALIDGLKAKNARQRTEILRVFSEYIDGGALTQIKPLGVLKAIAPFVADADKNVREAAIVGMVAAYRCEGDAAFKAAGKIADKEMAMIQERIKRMKVVPGQGAPISGGIQSSGARIVKAEPTIRGRASARSDSPPPQTPMRRSLSSNSERTPRAKILDPVDMEQNYDGTKTVLRPTRQSVAPRSDAATSRFDIDSDFLDDPYRAAREERMNRILNATTAIGNLESAHVQPSDLHFARDMKRTTSQSSIASSVETLEYLDKTIADVGSNNSNIANDAIAQLLLVAQSPEQLPLLHERADTLLQMCSLQIESSLATAPYSSMNKAGELVLNVFNLIQKIYVADDCSALQHLSTAVCVSLLKQLIVTVSSKILAESDDFLAIGRTANIIVIRLVKKCRPSSLLEASTHNMMNFGPTSDEWTMLLRILNRIMVSCSDINYVARTDLRQFFLAASEFYVYLEARASGTTAKTVNETLDNLNLGIENVVNAFREQALDVLRRIPRPHAKIVDKVNTHLATLKDTEKPEMPNNLPGQVDSPTGDFSLEKFWSLVHSIAIDFVKMPRTVPPLADYYKQYASRAPLMDQKLNRYMYGPLIRHHVEQYMEKGDKIVWPSETVLETLNTSRDTMLATVGDVAWGERKNPLWRGNLPMNGHDVPMMSSMMSDLPSIHAHNNENRVPSPIEPIRQPNKKTARRSHINKAELENLRARLDAVRGNE